MTTFRKTKSGEWVVFGSATVVAPGPVWVDKKGGTRSKVVVERVGKPFNVDGVAMVYGYIAAKGTAVAVAPPPPVQVEAPAECVGVGDEIEAERKANCDDDGYMF